MSSRKNVCTKIKTKGKTESLTKKLTKVERKNETKTGGVRIKAVPRKNYVRDTSKLPKEEFPASFHQYIKEKRLFLPREHYDQYHYMTEKQIKTLFKKSHKLHYGSYATGRLPSRMSFIGEQRKPSRVPIEHKGQWQNDNVMLRSKLFPQIHHEWWLPVEHMKKSSENLWRYDVFGQYAVLLGKTAIFGSQFAAFVSFRNLFLSIIKDKTNIRHADLQQEIDHRTTYQDLKVDLTRPWESIFNDMYRNLFVSSNELKDDNQYKRAQIIFELCFPVYETAGGVPIKLVSDSNVNPLSRTQLQKPYYTEISYLEVIEDIVYLLKKYGFLQLDTIILQHEFRSGFKYGTYILDVKDHSSKKHIRPLEYNDDVNVVVYDIENLLSGKSNLRQPKNSISVERRNIWFLRDGFLKPSMDKETKRPWEWLSYKNYQVQNRETLVPLTRELLKRWFRDARAPLPHVHQRNWLIQHVDNKGDINHKDDKDDDHDKNINIRWKLGKTKENLNIIYDSYLELLARRITSSEQSSVKAKNKSIEKDDDDQGDDNGDTKAPNLWLPVYRIDALYYRDERKTYCGKFWFVEPQSALMMNLGHTAIFGSKVGAFLALKSKLPLLPKELLQSVDYKSMMKLPHFDLFTKSIASLVDKTFDLWKTKHELKSIEEWYEKWIEYYLPVYNQQPLYSVPTEVGDPLYPCGMAKQNEKSVIHNHDFLDQLICQMVRFFRKYKIIALDTLIFQHEAGSKRSNTEILDTRENPYDPIYFKRVQQIPKGGWWKPGRSDIRKEDDFRKTIQYESYSNPLVCNSIWFLDYGMLTPIIKQVKVGLIGSKNKYKTTVEWKKKRRLTDWFVQNDSWIDIESLASGIAKDENWQSLPNLHLNDHIVDLVTSHRKHQDSGFIAWTKQNEFQ